MNYQRWYHIENILQAIIYLFYSYAKFVRQLTSVTIFGTLSIVRQLN